MESGRGQARRAAARAALGRVLFARIAAAFIVAAFMAGAAVPAAAAGVDLQALLAAMSVAAKVGQLFMVHAYGPAVTALDAGTAQHNRELHGVDDWRALLERYPVGGVIYFTVNNNIEHPAQVAALSNGLLQLALA